MKISKVVQTCLADPKWSWLSDSDCERLLRFATYGAPVDADLPFLRAATAIEDLSLVDAGVLLKCCHISMYDGGLGDSDLSHRAAVIDMVREQSRNSASSVFCHIAIICAAVTTKTQVQAGPWHAVRLLLLHVSQLFRQISFQRQLAWVLFIMGQSAALGAIDAELAASLGKIDGITDIDVQILRRAADKITARWNPPYLIKNILLKNTKPGSALAELGDDPTLENKVQVILSGRVLAWHERAKDHHRTKADLRDFLIPVGGPLLAEIVLRHYVAYKGRAGMSKAFVEDWGTSVAWGAAAGLALLMNLPLGLVGKSERFSAAHGGPEQQAFWGDLARRVASKHHKAVQGFSCPEAAVHLACDARKIFTFLTTLHLRYVRDGKVHREYVKKLRLSKGERPAPPPAKRRLC